MTLAEVDALLTAVRNNEVELVESLLVSGVDPDQQGTDGETPLVMAVKEALMMQRSYELATLQTLAAYCKQLNAPNSEGDSALLVAMRHKLVAGKKTLRPQNYRNDAAFLVSKILIEAGADVCAADADGTTALMFSLLGRCPEVTSLLLSAGADVTARNNSGADALMCAVSPYMLIGDLVPSLSCGIVCSAEAKPMGTAEEVSALLSAGARADRYTNRGRSTLEMAKLAVPSYLDLLLLFSEQ